MDHVWVFGPYGFGDPEIIKLAWTAAIFIPAFILLELHQKEPLVDLRLFARRNFGLGSIVNVILGMPSAGRFAGKHFCWHIVIASGPWDAYC
jgi:hypothetical protein